MFFLIPIAVALGVGAAAKGGCDLYEARALAASATAMHDAQVRALEGAARRADARAERYGRAVLAAQRDVLVPMATWIDRHAGSAKMSQAAFLARIEVPGHGRPDGPSLADVGVQIAAGTATALGTAAATPAAITTLVGMFGTASTGAAISSLSGAAATNATLAAIGGGPLAAGGGGIVAGEALLGAAVPVVGVFMLGGTLLVAGSRALTDAEGFAADVQRAVAEMRAHVALLERVEERFDEVEAVLLEVVRRARAAQSRLFAIPCFDPARDAMLFVTAMQLSSAVARILATPVVDPKTHGLNETMTSVLDDVTRSL